MDMQHIKAGVYGGLAGGVVFGALMAMMGMLPMVAKLVGSSSAVVGFGVHLMLSAIIGLLFSIVLGSVAVDKTRGALFGLIYGVVWWFLGPLIIMPVLLGMGVQLSVAGAQMALPSLGGHLLYGLVLGVLYPVIAEW